jgi:hypothetical protein
VCGDDASAHDATHALSREYPEAVAVAPV